MLKSGIKSLVALIAVFMLWTCIDPYEPVLKGYDSLLVVDGLITDADHSYSVRLSKTFGEQYMTPLLISDASVSVTDEDGNRSYFISKGKGIYKSDSTNFKGTVGKTYTLHIITSNGHEYESDPCMMQAVPDIDSLYFEKSQELINNATVSQDGISIYLDSKTESDQFFRYDYEETWKFKIPDPKRFNYLVDSVVEPAPAVNEYCWKSKKSSDILTYSNYSGMEVSRVNEKILFIPTDQSDRLLIRYSILVNQYSVSKKEFEFWENMKKINESGGDIFARQPFSIVSNIHNIADANERVLGYFQVSALKTRRKYITFSEVGMLGLNFYHYPCTRIEMAPEDYPHSRMDGPISMDELYAIYITAGYIFCEPIYKPGTLKVQKLVFAKPECVDCSLTGTVSKPDFWSDKN